MNKSFFASETSQNSIPNIKVTQYESEQNLQTALLTQALGFEGNVSGFAGPHFSGSNLPEFYPHMDTPMLSQHKRPNFSELQSYLGVGGPQDHFLNRFLNHPLNPYLNPQELDQDENDSDSQIEEQNFESSEGYQRRPCSTLSAFSDAFGKVENQSHSNLPGNFSKKMQQESYAMSPRKLSRTVNSFTELGESANPSIIPRPNSPYKTNLRIRSNPSYFLSPLIVPERTLGSQHDLGLSVEQIQIGTDQQEASNQQKIQPNSQNNIAQPRDTEQSLGETIERNWTMTLEPLSQEQAPLLPSQQLYHRLSTEFSKVSQNHHSRNVCFRAKSSNNHHLYTTHFTHPYTPRSNFN